MTSARRPLALLISAALAAGPAIAEAGQRSAPPRGSYSSAGRHASVSKIPAAEAPLAASLSVSLPSVRLGEPPSPPDLAAPSRAALNNAVPAPASGHGPAQRRPAARLAPSPAPHSPAPRAAAAEASPPAASRTQHETFEAIRHAAQDATGARIVEDARARGFALEPVRADELTAGAAAPASSGLKPAAPQGPGGGRSGAAAPPAPSGAPRGALGFLSSLLIAQVGVETAGLAVPQLANQLAGSFQSASLLPTVAFLALMSGSLVGGALVDKRGVKRVYLGLFALRVASASVLAWTGIAGTLTFPLLVGLFGVDYFFLGATRVTEAVVPNALYSGRGKVAGFSNFTQMVIESMGVIGLTVGGIAIAAVGLHSALGAFAGAIGLGAVVAFVSLRRAAFAAPSTSAPAPSPREVWRALKDYPSLRVVAGAYVINSVLSAFVYFTVAPTFGLFAGGSSTTFWTTALYAGGGFVATLLAAWMNARRDRRLAGADGAQRDAAERTSLVRTATGWSRALAAVLLLGGWTFAGAAAFGPGLALGFMFPFGLTAIAAYVALESTLKTEAPPALRGSIVGYARAAAQLAAAVSFPLIGWAFDRLSPGGPGVAPSVQAMGVIGAILGVAALATLRLARRR